MFSETFESLISLLLSVIPQYVDSSLTRLSALRADDNLEEFRGARRRRKRKKSRVKHGEANNET